MTLHGTLRSSTVQPLSNTRDFTVLVDGDVVAYRAACSPIRTFNPFSEEDDKRPPTKSEAIAKVDTLMIELLEGSTGKDILQNIPCETFITGKTNFRHDYAVTAPYKGNRAETVKPEFLPECRAYLRLKYNATLSVNEEADDLLATRATEIGPDEACIASTDKDMLQVNCWQWNITKKVLTYVEPFEGLRWFYGQLIEGDRADNIIGVRNIGPKKREKILADCTDEIDLLEACTATFVDSGLTKEEALERVLENGRLAWLRREPEQIWRPFV
jgi:5'-3' exonuclease